MPQSNQPGADIDVLWKRFVVQRDLETKNELVMHYLPLVRTIVTRMMLTHHDYNNYNDLINCGVLGLMDAVDRFDIHRDVKFETYAYMRIRGEIIDHLRKQDWAPSNLRRQISQVTKAFDTLEMELGRTVAEEEVAEYLGMDIKDLRNILQKSNSFNLLYFEDMLNENYADSESFQDMSFSPSEQVEKLEIKDMIAQMIEGFPENERMVVTLYYYEEMPFKEIAEILHVSVSRISQIHSKVLLRLRNMLQHYYAM